MTKSSLLLAVSAPVLLAAGAFHRSSVQDQPPVPEPRDAHVSYAEFEPQPGREAELEQLVVEVTRGLEGQAGLLRYAVLREESGLVRVFSAWENDEAWERFTKSERYGEMHGPEQQARAHALLKRQSFSSCRVAAAWHAEDASHMEQLHRHLLELHR